MPMRDFCRFLLSGALTLALQPAVAAHAQMSMSMAMDTGDPVSPEKLPPPQHMAGVGNAWFPITANAQAQLWFTQGYNLYYDFWDYEATRAFEQAVRADEHCAMCYWGLYQAERFRHSETKDFAQASLAGATRLAGAVTPREKLYIRAAEAHEAAIRDAGSEDKANFDKEIEILRSLVKENATDTNARILLSDAVGDGFDDQGEPKKGQKESLALLEGVLKEQPDNSIANHLWIHAVEASAHPERALHSAEILGSLAPASGHMVHMPGHIFYRTGDYARAQVSFNASAVADEGYMRQQRVAVDNDWNYVHNLMYSIANLMEAGQLKQAAAVSAKLKSARGHLEDTLYPWSARDAVARMSPELPVALRTADWSQVIHVVEAAHVSQIMPHMNFLAAGLLQFAQGMQAVEAHEPEAAARHALLLDAALWQMSQQIKYQEALDAKNKPVNGNGPASPDPLPKPLESMLSIMSLELRGSVMALQGKLSDAQTQFDMAKRQEKDLGYHEPPFYIRPTAESEAAAMAAAGQWPQARAAAALAEQERPNSGFALYLKAEALEKAGDTSAATLAYQNLLNTWKTADPDLPQLQKARTWMSTHAIASVARPAYPEH